MEGVSGSKKEYSKTSSDGHEQTIDLPIDEATSGRFYECIFCKRGFSTAQALGGHMNIHRKDRAKNNNIKNNIINPSASKQGEDIINHSSIILRSNYHPPVSDSLKNYSMLFPTVAPPSISRVAPVRPREMSLFGQDLHLGSKATREEKQRKIEGEVDLELRLGN